MSWLLVPLAFAAMFCQDILSVWLVRAESQGRAHAAGCWDAAQDACKMAWLYAGGDAIFVSHDRLLAAAVIAVTLLADYHGSRTGVVLGKRLDARRAQARVQADLDDQLRAWLLKRIRRGGGRP